MKKLTALEKKIKYNNEWIRKNMKQMNIKMSPALYEAIKEDAKKRHKTLRGYCIWKLSEGLKIVDKTEKIPSEE